MLTRCQALQDNDLRRSADTLSDPLSGQVSELTGLPPNQRSGALAELLEAWGVADVIVDGMQGLFEATTVAAWE